MLRLFGFVMGCKYSFEKDFGNQPFRVVSNMAIKGGCALPPFKKAKPSLPPVRRLLSEERSAFLASSAGVMSYLGASAEAGQAVTGDWLLSQKVLVEGAFS